MNTNLQSQRSDTKVEPLLDQLGSAADRNIEMVATHNTEKSVPPSMGICEGTEELMRTHEPPQLKLKHQTTLLEEVKSRKVQSDTQSFITAKEESSK